MIKTTSMFLFEESRDQERILFSPVKLTDFPNYRPEPGYLYVATRALSSRVNANLDAWPVDELRKSYKTFLGRPVHVEHHNWDYTKAKGIITDVLYKEHKTASGLTDAGVYLLMEIDAKTFPRLAKAILDGKIKGVSMGADVGFTTCSACGNKAENPKEYCFHVGALKGQYVQIKQGNRTVQALVYENCHDIGFFEISCVFDPADESAFILDKKYFPSK